MLLSTNLQLFPLISNWYTFILYLNSFIYQGYACRLKIRWKLYQIAFVQNFDLDDIAPTLFVYTRWAVWGRWARIRYMIVDFPGCRQYTNGKKNYWYRLFEIIILNSLLFWNNDLMTNRCRKLWGLEKFHLCRHSHRNINILKNIF